MALLFDLAALSARQTDDVLHSIFCKAHGHEGDGEGIWEPHDNPFLARLVELFTQRGLARIESVRVELQDWLSGQQHAPGALLPRPEMPGRTVWDSRTLGVVRLYLRSLPPAAWTLDDHMLMVDYLQQRYLSPDDLRTEAQWMADRASIMGRVQAAMGAVTAAQADALLQAVPVDPLAVWTWQPVQRKVAEFARHRSAEAVTRVSDGMRAALRQTVSREVEAAELAGRPVWSTSLQTRLQDEFAIQNRDWRRVALTESAEAMNHGFIAAQQPGQRLKRVEQYRGVCSYCAKIDGRVLEVVDASEPEKDGATQVWVGKTNVGRSVAPRKRVGDLLVEREPEERYWIAAGAQHPNCRGRWVPVITDQPGDDTDFGDWLRETLQGVGPARA